MFERYASPALHQLPATLVHTAPLNGVEAQMYDRLWRAMVEGWLKPGVKLREDEIGDSFKVSRTVVRKVLVVMEQEGIVSLPLNRGAYVAMPTPADTRAVHEAFVMAMRYMVSRLAAPDYTLSDTDLALIEQHITAQKRAEDESDIITSGLLSGEFMILLSAIQGNRIMTHLVAKLFLRYVFALTLFQAVPLPLVRSQFQSKVLQSILDSKPEEALSSIEHYFAALERTLRFDITDDDPDLKSILSTPVKARAVAAS